MTQGVLGNPATVSVEGSQKRVDGEGRGSDVVPQRSSR
jgi:hypothetical protein